MSVRLLMLLVPSLLLTACASSGGYHGAPRDGYARCGDCGTVNRIERVYGEREATGGGAVAGAIVGGVLGNQVGSGSGRRAATAAGAVIGGVAGHRIEENARSAPRYELFIRMDDGRRIVIEQRDLGGIREGDRVRVGRNQARLM